MIIGPVYTIKNGFSFELGQNNSMKMNDLHIYYTNIYIYIYIYVINIMKMKRWIIAEFEIKHVNSDDAL